MTNKEKYKQLCEENSDIPLFSQAWWLEAVCINGSWDVALFEKGGKILGSLPYYLKRKGPFKIITMPPLTQTMGPWINYPENQKYTKKLSYEKEIMNNLIDQLPKTDYFCQNFHPSVTNWLPFYWRGFKQSTRYTYQIHDLSNLDKVINEFNKSTRQKLSKTKEITISKEATAKEFYAINKQTFDRQKINIPYSFDFFSQLDDACLKHKSRKIFLAKDDMQQVHGGMYIIYDNQSIYCLMGGGNPLLRDSGAKILINFHAMKFASKKNLIFDFEGSMIESIAHFYRQFGAKQTPYFQIKKTNSKLLKCREFWNEFF